MAIPGYAGLHCRSNFSFLTGASHPAELVQRAQALGYAALAITDECSLAGVVRAHLEAQRCGVHLVIRAEMRLTAVAAGLDAGVSGNSGSADADADADARNPARTAPRLVLLAQTRRGYGPVSRRC